MTITNLFSNKNRNILFKMVIDRLFIIDISNKTDHEYVELFIRPNKSRKTHGVISETKDIGVSGMHVKS